MQVTINKNITATSFKAKTNFMKSIKPEDVPILGQKVTQVFNELLKNEHEFKAIGDDFTRITIKPWNNYIATKVFYEEPVSKSVKTVVPTGIIEKFRIKMGWSTPKAEIIQKELDAPAVSRTYSIHDESKNNSTSVDIYDGVMKDAETVKLQRQIQKKMTEVPQV